jgi:hypothetical protein
MTQVQAGDLIINYITGFDGTQENAEAQSQPVTGSFVRLKYPDPRRRLLGEEAFRRLRREASPRAW